MKTLKRLPTAPLRMMALTVLVAIAATAAQTASAQPQDMRGGPERHHGPRGGGGEGPGQELILGNPRILARMLDTVSASADQRAQIKQIAEAARADLKAQHEATRKLREDSAALFTQPTVDARAAEALRQQLLAQHDQASKRQMQMMLDISRVLTPEQRQKLADRLAQRRAMMERHRAERTAAEPKPAR